MNERIQKALDGELPREALDAAERAELERQEEAIDGALAPVRAEATPDVTGAVMRRVAGMPRHRATESPWQRALAWLWAPRPVSVRPAWGLAAAAVAGLLVVPAVDRGPSDPVARTETGSPAMVATAPDAPVFVHFRLDAADARSVQLAADFTGWEPRYTLSQTVPGVWTVVVPVAAGVHQYAFVVDGERWVADPLAPPVEDGFGGTNSRLDVVRPERGRAL